jgi:exo-1,4-beta-D-glucosaminidase
MAAPKKPGAGIESRVEALSSNWKMQPVNKLGDTDEKLISQNVFDSESWYKAIVPGTVLGSWATTGVIKDPYFGINMQELDYDQFKQPWWFRTTFQIDANDLKKSVSLRFNGINYRSVDKR